jgi:hypothetical protein
MRPEDSRMPRPCFSCRDSGASVVPSVWGGMPRKWCKRCSAWLPRHPGHRMGSRMTPLGGGRFTISRRFPRQGERILILREIILWLLLPLSAWVYMYSTGQGRRLRHLFAARPKPGIFRPRTTRSTPDGIRSRSGQDPGKAPIEGSFEHLRPPHSFASSGSLCRPRACRAARHLRYRRR